MTLLDTIKKLTNEICIADNKDPNNIVDLFQAAIEQSSDSSETNAWFDIANLYNRRLFAKITLDALNGNYLFAKDEAEAIIRNTDEVLATKQEHLKALSNTIRKSCDTSNMSLLVRARVQDLSHTEIPGDSVKEKREYVIKELNQCIDYFNYDEEQIKALADYCVYSTTVNKKIKNLKLEKWYKK